MEEVMLYVTVRLVMVTVVLGTCALVSVPSDAVTKHCQLSPETVADDGTVSPA
jgi:hypothetical protein